MNTEWNSARDWRVSCQSNWGVPKTIDLWDLVRNQRTLKGAFPLVTLSRLVQGLLDQVVIRDLVSVSEDEQGVVWFEVTGESRVGGRSSIEVEVQAKVLVTCQRCLEPMVQTLLESVRFDVVTQAQFDALDNEDIDPDESDVVVGSRQFDLLELLEDQLILAIPYVPKHLKCQPKAPLHDVGAEDEGLGVEQKPNPFDVLARLKGRQ
ncbi:YceD family protein [Orrella marina]|nr:YceD family protein [Orrella marina]